MGISDQPAQKPTPKQSKKEPEKKPLKTPNRNDLLPEDRPLTPRQEKFCRYYLELSNGKQAAIKAGYSAATAEAKASQLLRRVNVAKRIKTFQERAAKPCIATSAEVMEFYTKAMRGEIKDQFGLDMSASDRIKAASELAKRTIDLDQKLAGKPDATIEIKLDWDR